MMLEIINTRDYFARENFSDAINTIGREMDQIKARGNRVTLVFDTRYGGSGNPGLMNLKNRADRVIIGVEGQPDQIVKDKSNPLKDDEKSAIIESLPITAEAVDALPLDALMKMITDLSTPGTVIRGTAGMDCNTFLSYAAVRMTREFVRREQEIQANCGIRDEVTGSKHDLRKMIETADDHEEGKSCGYV